jgi:hypothetical protein
LKISLRNNQLDTTTVNQPACRWALYESADSRTILEYGHALHELDSNKNITDSNNHIERIASSRYISDGLWTPDSGVFEKSHSSTYWQRATAVSIFSTKLRQTWVRRCFHHSEIRVWIACDIELRDGKIPDPPRVTFNRTRVSSGSTVSDAHQSTPYKCPSVHLVKGVLQVPLLADSTSSGFHILADYCRRGRLEIAFPCL